MRRERLLRRARQLRPGTAALLGKLAAVLAAETVVSPVWWALTSISTQPERYLALQNRWRQRALRWLKPEFFREDPRAPRSR